MPPKRKLHKLSLENKQDFMLIGIASHENDYRLSWALNQELNFNFIKEEDFVLNHPKHKIEIGYSKYCSEMGSELFYSLISNKSEKGFLLTQNKNIDFVLKVPQEIGGIELNELLRKLKGVDIVITAFVLENISERIMKLFDF